MDMKWLKTFIIAAQTENLRQTSEELFLTQPAITKHVKRLEAELQIELFHRKGKKISLTPAGHQFFKYAQTIVQNYDECLKDFQLWRQGYNKKLVIAVAPQIAASILPTLLREFINEHPSIEVIVNIRNSYNIGNEISTGKADLGLTRIKPLQVNLNCKTLHEDSVILVAPKQKGREYEQLNEKHVIQNYRLITHNHPDYWDSLLEEIKKYYPTLQTMTVNQVEVTKRFIGEGLGISYLPQTMVAEELGEGKMIEVNPDLILPPKSYTYLVTKIMTEEVMLFSKFLHEAFMRIK